MENKELRERMLSGKMYNDLSVELVQRREQAVFLTNDYNSTYGKPKEVREALLRKLLRCIGSSVHFEPNFRCEFGFNISIGNNFLANFDCIMLDGNLITIGDNVLLGPRVGLYTANHALDPQERLMGGCYAHPIVIEDNVWVGAGVHIMGGVTVGRNSVIGAGSVVLKAVPPNSTVVGVPGHVVKKNDVRIPREELNQTDLPDPVEEDINVLQRTNTELTNRLLVLEENVRELKKELEKTNGK